MWLAAVASVPLIVMVVIFGRAGHGTVVPLIALFPFAELAALKDGDFNQCDMCGLVAALVQLPLYGFALRMGARTGRLRGAAMLIAIVHAVGIILAAIRLYR